MSDISKHTKIDLSSLPELTNSVYYPYYTNDSRYLVLYGGAGSGKSVFAAQKIIVRTLSEKNHKFLVLRKVGTTIRNSTFAIIRETISQWGLTNEFEVNKTDMEITCKNGNKICFSGLDDQEKLKSYHGITGIWVEEASELEKVDLDQLNLRLRGFTTNYKQIMITFNPISADHWIKTTFFDTKQDNATVLKTTYKDNEFIDDEYKAVLEGYKDTDPYWYSVYALGEWGVIGHTIFNAQMVNERIAELRKIKPLASGMFTYKTVNEKIVDSSIKWVDDDSGYIRIFKQPEDRKPYVIGGDTSGDGSDKFVGQVLDNITGEQVAVLHHQFDEDLYAKQMYCLGKYYNHALLAIEVNFSTYPIKELQRLGYRKQFKREVMDTITKKKQSKYGFRTDKTSRPVIIANLVQIVRENIELINDIDTLNEMLTFVRNEKGKAEAIAGKHDDLIMGLAIAFKGREQQKFSLDPLPQPSDPFNPTPEEKHSSMLKKITGGAPPSKMMKWG